MRLRNFLLPTPSNNYAPSGLQKTACLVMAGLILLSFSLVSLQTTIWQSSTWLVGTVLPAVVVDLTNTERQTSGLNGLKRSALLDEAARLKAEHMVKHEYFAHYSRDGITPWFWFDQVGYTYAHAGENLAIHFSDSGSLMAAWMNSPSHRANIVGNKYTEIGVAAVSGRFEGYDTTYVVQLFGTPAGENLTTNPGSSTSLAMENVRQQPEVLTDSVPVLASNLPEPTVASEMIVETDIFPVLAADEVTGWQTELVATSSGLPALETVSAEEPVLQESSRVSALATKPKRVLQLVYLVLGSGVVIMLLLSIFISIRHVRPLQATYGILLLLLMCALFYLHHQLASSVVVAVETKAEITNPA